MIVVVERRVVVHGKQDCDGYQVFSGQHLRRRNRSAADGRPVIVNLNGGIKLRQSLAEPGRQVREIAAQ